MRRWRTGVRIDLACSRLAGPCRRCSVTSATYLAQSIVFERFARAGYVLSLLHLTIGYLAIRIAVAAAPASGRLSRGSSTIGRPSSASVSSVNWPPGGPTRSLRPTLRSDGQASGVSGGAKTTRICRSSATSMKR